MTEGQQLLEKLRRVEALFASTPFEGERDAAADVMARIRERLAAQQALDPPVEFKFTLTDSWSQRLMIALLRRYGLSPYRLRGQRRTTVMARVPQGFVDQTLWPEFVQLDNTLRAYLDEVTDRVIREAIHTDVSDADERSQPTLEGPARAMGAAP